MIVEDNTDPGDDVPDQSCPRAVDQLAELLAGPQGEGDPSQLAHLVQQLLDEAVIVCRGVVLRQVRRQL